MYTSSRGSCESVHIAHISFVGTITVEKLTYINKKKFDDLHDHVIEYDNLKSKNNVRKSVLVLKNARKMQYDII